MTSQPVDAAVLPRPLRPFAPAAALGAVTLPKPILAAVARLVELTDAAAEASRAAMEARTASDAARAAVVRKLAADGPTPNPAKPVREAAERATAAVADADLLRDAVRRAEARIETAFLDASRELAGQLSAALALVLADARPDAEVVAAARVTWADPASFLELSPDVATAVARLAPLAARHDAVRVAALALRDDLRLAGRADSQARQHLLADLDAGASTRGSPRRDAAEEWVASFALAGYLVGPANRWNGTGDPRYATRWQIVGRGEHPVARLVRAALAEPDPVAADDEPEVVVRPGARTPIKPGPGPLGR